MNWRYFYTCTDEGLVRDDILLVINVEGNRRVQWLTLAETRGEKSGGYRPVLPAVYDWV